MDARGSFVDFEILRTKLPEIIWEYYRLVDSFCARLISLPGTTWISMKEKMRNFQNNSTMKSLEKTYVRGCQEVLVRF